jgi:hypothetical protein
MKRHIPTRWSHLVGYSGVGALVRADNDLFVIMDIGHWTEKDGESAGERIRYVELLIGTLGLGKKVLRQPPMARLVDNGAVDGICVPAARFPRWTICPTCGLLHYLPWRRREAQADGTVEDPRCNCHKRSRLHQIDWVLAHPDGGLRDVPWHLLAHQDARSGRDCRENRDEPYLRLLSNRSGGPAQLRCERCQAVTSFNPRKNLKLSVDPSRQPWQRTEAKNSVPSQQEFVILAVNDSRLYLPRTTSGLVIPPESRVGAGDVIDRLFRNDAAQTELARCRTPLARKGVLRRLADAFGCTPQALEDALHEIEKGWPLYGETATPGQLMEKEYQALTVPIPRQMEGESFITEHLSEGWRTLALDNDNGVRPSAIRDAVQQLVAVTRLREIRVFRGFYRVNQGFDDRMRPNSTGDKAEPWGPLVQPDLTDDPPWLPAIELYGEGIFFTLDEAMLRRWERQDGLAHRARTMQKRLENAGIRLNEEPPSPLTPRFILLHTLAHLLIRRLEAEAGYPAASIRERIYCAGGKTPMSGILAYVAVPDIAGSLGGLAELAQPRRFMQLLASVFDHADWCSLDPVCAEHQGQGPSQLNRAACHACALVPEPSCQFGNLLLDRVFIAGDLGGTIQPLLAFADEG